MAAVRAMRAEVDVTTIAMKVAKTFGFGRTTLYRSLQWIAEETV
jgi:DNA-binding phage protein